MTGTIARTEVERGAIQLLLDLEAEGKADDTSLTLTDPDMEYDTWEALGRFLGSVDKRARWYIGDWINFGEALFGHEAAQGIEATTKERYSEVERVTGLDHQTLLNIASVCSRVKKAVRRRELGFWIHQEVAALEPDEQASWLQRAIDEGWTTRELRQMIREANKPPDDGDGTPPRASRREAAESLTERLLAAAEMVDEQAQSAGAGSGWLVPDEPMAQLRAALGKE